MSPLYFFYPKTNPVPTFQTESSRLMTAAVINQRFRKMLLTDPATAIASGYGGEAFSMGSEEKSRILAIRASTLEEFARQLTQIEKLPSHSLA
ncbi:MAG: hypothetical protein U1B80_10620 [Anaerolineaceae bacterium]|nr:hypothetical protein [Anaerolineaceae bacterium]